MSKAEEYRQRAAEQAHRAEASTSEEVREIFVRLAAALLTLAENEEWCYAGAQ
jgi:hypothetical protein